MTKRSDRKQAQVEGANEQAKKEMLDWLTLLNVVVPPQPDIALRWTDDGCIEVPLAEAVEDEDLVITPEQIELADLPDVLVYMVREADRRAAGPPSKWRPSRWRLTGKVASWMYVWGVTCSGGSISFEGGWPPVYRLPRLSSVWRGRRCYVLRLPMWWWSCQYRQGWRIRGRHRPEQPFVMGICAACLPCPECGAHGDCLPTCESVYG